MNGEQGLRSRRGGPEGDGEVVDGQPAFPGSPLLKEEDEGELFPMTMALQILAIAVVIFTVIPYLGFTMPPAPRTDLPWWQTGMLYQVDVEVVGEEKLDSLAALGISAVKLEGINSLQPTEEDRKTLSDIKDKDLNVIITLGPSILEGKTDFASIVLSSSKMWLDSGASGVSVHLPDNHGTSLLNITAALRQLAENYVGSDEDFVLVMIETSTAEEEAQALAGGADLVTVPPVCTASSGGQLSESLQQVLAEKEDKSVCAWQSCPHTSKQQLLPLMLPGTTIISSSHLKLLQKDELQITLKQFQTLLTYKKSPAMHWGQHEQVYVTDSIYSMIRWANGKIYDKYLLIINVGEKSSNDNYVLKMKKFTIPKKGRIVMSTSKKYEFGSIVEMANLEVEKGESVVIQFSLFGV